MARRGKRGRGQANVDGEESRALEEWLLGLSITQWAWPSCPSGTLDHRTGAPAT